VNGWMLSRRDVRVLADVLASMSAYTRDELCEHMRWTGDQAAHYYALASQIQTIAAKEAGR
jgi:hypothetical protein